MNFVSPLFLPGLALAVLLYIRLPGHTRPWLLLSVSLAFFLIDSPASALVLLAVIALSWLIGISLERVKHKKALLLAGSALMLGNLCAFKAAPFGFIPIGISFYTFQALAYCIDVCRGRFPAVRNPLRYALFVAFFPQVVAGPIERPGDLMPQLAACPSPTPGDFRVGGFLILRGFARKLIVADGLAPLVDALYARCAALTGPEALTACVLFALQIYTDFAGYTDIARGAARLLGIRLSENFDHPYRARGLRDFWRRWHMTLTGWLRDYVYIPLGGSQRGRLRTLCNVLIVFSLSGLWHGLGLHFLAWGLAHGLLMLMEDRLPRRPGPALTFALVCLLWPLFRATSLASAGMLYAALPTGWQMAPSLISGFVAAHPWLTLRLIAMPFILLLTDRVPRETDVPADMKALLSGYGLFLVILLCLFANLRNDAAAPFIYFQF